MMKNHLILFLAAALTALPTLAHHGDAGRYEEEVIVVTGTVVALQLVDPHSVLIFDVTGPDSKVVRWQAELFGRAQLTRQGWTRNTLKPGDKITLTGRRVKSGAAYMNMTDRAGVVLTDTGKLIFKTDNYGTNVKKDPVVVN